MTWTLKVIDGGQTYPIPSWVVDPNMGYDMLFTGGFEGEYATDGVNASHLVDEAIIVATWNGVEYPDSRWWIQGGEGVSTRDEGISFKVIAKSLKDVFRRVIVRASKPYKPLVYDDRKVGYILNSLFTAAQARGAMTGLTWDFTATNDSAGNAWSDTIDQIEFPAGQPYADVLSSFIENGYIELRISGTVIQAYNFGAMGADKSATVELRAGQDYVETPYRWSSEDRVKYSLALGDGRVYREDTRALTPVGPFGRYEQAISVGGAKKTSVLSKVNSAALDRLANVRKEFTRKLIVTPNRPVPVVDYSLGDYIFDRTDSMTTKLRVRSFTISPGTDGTLGGGSISLNDQFLEGQIRLAKKIQNISSPAGGTVNAPPAVFVPDTSIPNPPTAVTITSGPYVTSSGFTQQVVSSLMRVSWTPPTTNTDTTDIDDIRSYEIRYKKSADTDYKTQETTFTYLEVKSLLPGDTYDVQVRTWDKYGNSSDWTTSVSSGALVGDAVAPNTPSTPTADMRLGAAYITWNGKDNLGQDMPADLREVRVHVSTTSGFTPTTATLKAIISSRNGGTVPIVGLTFGTTYYARLIAVDYSLNESAVSAQVSFVPKQIVSTELDVVLPGSTSFSDINNLIVDGSFENASIHAARSGVSVGTWAQNTTGPLHGLNSVGVSGNGTYYLENGSTSQISDVSVVPNSKIYVAMSSKRTASSSGAAQLRIDWLTGSKSIYSTVYPISSSAAANMTWVSQEAVVQVPSNTSIAYMRVSIVVASNTVGQFWYFDSVQARLVIGTALIEDLAVTNAKIGSVSANKITAGEIQAGEYISAGPKLGTHAELASDGFRSYWLDPDSGGLVEVVRIGTSQSDVLAIQNSSGDIVASIGEEGQATFTGLQVTSADKGFSIFGTSWEDWMNTLPKGIVAKTKATSQPPNTTGAEVSQIEFRAVLSPGRNYRIVLGSHIANADSVNGKQMLRRIRYATGGAAVTTSSPMVSFSRFPLDAGDPYTVPGCDSEIDVSSLTGDTEYRFLLTIQNEDGTNVMNLPYSVDYPMQMYVEDKGPALADSAAIAQRTSIWRSGHQEVYYIDGNSRMSEATWLSYSQKPLVCGDCAGSMNSWSIFGFQDVAISGETSRTLASAMSGATIIKAELRLESQLSENEGGGKLRLRPHTQTAPYPTTGATVPTGSYVESTGWRTGDAKWIDVTSIFASSISGFVLDPGPDATSVWHHHIRSALNANLADRPQLRVTYRR